MSCNRRAIVAGLATLSLYPITAAFGYDAALLNAPPAIGDMSLGPADAKITIIEYASASCPNCASFHRSTFGDLRKAYIDTNKIRFVMREYPHNAAALAAFMLARCGPKEKYFPLIDQFFTTQSEWTTSPREGLLKIALEAGFTAAEFERCVTDPQIAADILSIRDRAKSIGVRGVPTIFINGELYDGDRSFEDFRLKLDLLLR